MHKKNNSKDCDRRDNNNNNNDNNNNNMTKSLILCGKRDVPYTRVCLRIFKQSQTNPKTFHGEVYGR